MKLFTIRKATNADLNKLMGVFKSSIISAASEDYSIGEINEWLRTTENRNRWVKLIEEQHVLLAEIEHAVVGFASLKQPNYLDFLYVHGDFQRRGIAQQLLDEVIFIARSLNEHSITSDVSITTKPFFEKNGFKVIRKNRNERGTEVLINYHMSLLLPTV